MKFLLAHHLAPVTLSASFYDDERHPETKENGTLQGRSSE